MPARGSCPQKKQQRPTWRKPGGSQPHRTEGRPLLMEHFIHFQSENCTHINTQPMTRASGRKQRAFHGNGGGAGRRRRRRSRKHLDKTLEELVSCLLCITQDSGHSLLHLAYTWGATVQNITLNTLPLQIVGMCLGNTLSKEVSCSNTYKT